MNTIKSGWKTTEFWGKIVLQLIALLSAFRGLVNPEHAVIIGSLLEFLYGCQRALVKQPSITTVVDNSTTTQAQPTK